MLNSELRAERRLLHTFIHCTHVSASTADVPCDTVSSSPLTFHVSQRFTKPEAGNDVGLTMRHTEAHVYATLESINTVGVLWLKG